MVSEFDENSALRPPASRAARVIQRLRVEFSPRITKLRFGILRDDLNGLDFLRAVQPETLGLNPELSFRSSPSGDGYLRAALRALNVTANDRIIDIGCGKGSAMRVMLGLPFAKVAGIDLSEQVVEIARRNFERMGVPSGRVQVSAADATQFDGLDEFNFIYAYNPFPEVVFEAFLKRVDESLQRCPRPLTFIYNNAVCEAVLLRGGRFRREAQFATGHAFDIRVYRSL